MTDQADLFSRAYAFHQAGDIPRASALYRQILQENPDHLDALQLFGVAAHQQSDQATAIVALERAVRIDATSAMLHSNLGTAYQSSGRTEDAIRSFRAAIELDESFAGAHFNLALALEAEGARDEAIIGYRETLRIDPEFTAARLNLGILLKEQGQLAEAIECFEKVVAVAPDAVEALSNLGASLYQSGDDQRAAAIVDRAMELAPREARLPYLKGLIDQRQGRLLTAAEQFERAAMLHPGLVDAHFRLGRIYQDAGRCGEAEQHYQAVLTLQPGHVLARINRLALSIDPDEPEAARNCCIAALRADPECPAAGYNLGNIERDSDRLDSAAECYESVLSHHPELVEAWVNLGVVRRRQGDLTEAIACQDRALALCPHDPHARFHRGIALLHAGKFEQGWPDYEARFQHQRNHRQYGAAAWNGERLSDETLLILSEQGLGDEITFATCLPDIAPLVQKCIVECDPRLVSIFRRSFTQPQFTFVPRPVSRSEEHSHDRETAIGSLPRLFRPTRESFPQRSPLLHADSARLTRWRERMSELGDGLKVGLSWRGGNTRISRERRSLPLEQWQPLLELPGVQFINLQYGAARDEAGEVARQTGCMIHDWSDVDPVTDLENTAAQIAALDLVISVDNSTVHLAGALGTAVWTLLPFSANWRWLHRGSTALWYPSMRLFRQPQPGRWGSVIDDVSAALTKETQQHTTGDRAPEEARSQSRPESPAAGTTAAEQIPSGD